MTLHQRGILALRIICGTRSPQISAWVWVGTRKFCSASASAYGSVESDPTSRPPAFEGQPLPYISVARQVWEVPCIPRKSWLRTKTGLVYRICAPGRGVVGVVKGQERVAQQGRHQAADVIQLFGIARRFLDGGAQVEFALGLGMFFGPIAEAHRVLLIGGEGRAG